MVARQGPSLPLPVLVPSDYGSRVAYVCGVDLVVLNQNAHKSRPAERAVDALVHEQLLVREPCRVEERLLRIGLELAVIFQNDRKCIFHELGNVVAVHAVPVAHGKKVLAGIRPEILETHVLVLVGLVRVRSQHTLFRPEGVLQFELEQELRFRHRKQLRIRLLCAAAVAGALAQDVQRCVLPTEGSFLGREPRIQRGVGAIERLVLPPALHEGLAVRFALGSFLERSGSLAVQELLVLGPLQQVFLAIHLFLYAVLLGALSSIGCALQKLGRRLLRELSLLLRLHQMLLRLHQMLLRLHQMLLRGPCWIRLRAEVLAFPVFRRLAVAEVLDLSGLNALPICGEASVLDLAQQLSLLQLVRLLDLHELLLLLLALLNQHLKISGGVGLLSIFVGIAHIVARFFAGFRWLCVDDLL